MLIDEVNKAKNDGETIVAGTGACTFCKQVMNIKLPETWSAKKGDELATQLCRCTAAVEHTSRLKKLEMLNAAMEELFGEESKRNVDSDTKDVIRALAINVINGVFIKASFELKQKRLEDPIEKVKIYTKKSLLYIDIEKKIQDSTLI